MLSALKAISKRADRIESTATFYSVHAIRRSWRSVAILGSVLLATAAGCSDKGTTGPTAAPGFLGGTAGNREIGIVLNSTGKALTMFQLGAPTVQVAVPFGASATITPVGFSLQKRLAAVPLGDAASVAVVNLETATVQKFFTFPTGNTTGSAWSNDTTVFAANTTTNKVGRFYSTQASTGITTTVDVANSPTAIAYASGRILVVSGNLVNYSPVGNGIVTAINPATMAILGTAQMGGTNSSDAAVGPDGLLYVINTGDYVTQASMTILNPATMTVVTTVPNVGIGAGQITIDANGVAYISSFSNSTIVWDTRTRAFIRGTNNVVCAKRSTGDCRGAAAAAASAGGKLYQLFFGAPAAGLSPYAFVFSATTFALTDSIAVGPGPVAIAIRTF
ncbi:MAG: hypothetical protein M3Y64_09630 [Gemmatimonadota bacterium]|nr:hypothetical protein [Gemmatimonadota bacterium]